MIFVALALAGFLFLAVSFLFGHDHDHDLGGHDFDHDHDASHSGGDANEHSVSIFSLKVIATFVMGFGAVGAIAFYNGCSVTISSLLGIAGGVVIGFVMWGMLSLIAKQQASSETIVRDLVGKVGSVTVPVTEGSLGEIGIMAPGGYCNFPVRSKKPIAKGHQVRVVEASTSILTVEEVE